VRTLFAGPTQADCTTAAALAYWKGLLDTIGDEEFDKRFRRGIDIGFDRNTGKVFIAPQFTGRSKENKDIYLPGDWRNFLNWPEYNDVHPGGFWTSENAINMGNGKYQGLGSEILTKEQMQNKLDEEFNRGLTPEERGKSYTDHRHKFKRVDFMGRPDPSFMKR
jgi:hypothetical protein